MKRIFCAVLLASWSTSAPALAAPTRAPGLDCACSAIGAYLDPIGPDDPPIANGLTGLTPNGKYMVTATSQLDGTTLVSITTVPPPVPAKPVLSEAGVSWSFSPDDDRFVIMRTAPLPYATLYNLAGATPATPIYTTPDIGAGGQLAFSPNGHYALGMWLTPNQEEFTIDVRDALTGVQVYSDVFTFKTVPGAALPAGETQVDSVVVGFGPDTLDRSLVYAWVSSNNQKNWALVNLLRSTPPVRGWITPSNYGFRWGFSPCGDALALVTDDSQREIKQLELHSTLDFARIGYTEYPLGDPDFFSCDATSHLVKHYMTFTPLAPNLADNACGGTTSVPPVAAFSAQASGLTYVDIPFTDQSTTPSGTITDYRWSFGDGSTDSVASPLHQFISPGSYDVQLTVTNSQGRADSVSHSISIAPNLPPVASFTYTPLSPVKRDVVTFTSTSTNDDGVPTAYWSIDNVSMTGLVVQAKTCAPVLHVTLTARDNPGQEDTISQDIPVATAPDVVVPAGGDLAAAAAAACPGDTLVLEAGHYPGGVTLNGVNLHGQGAGATFIDGFGDATLSNGWVLTLGSIVTGLPPATVTVSDLTVDGGGSSTSEGGGILIRAESSILLSHVEAAHNGGLAGIWGYNNNSGLVDIEDSSVHHNDARGIWLDNQTAVTVLRTDIAFNLGGGAAVTESSNVLFAFNDVHDNSGGAHGAGLQADFSMASEVSHNRFYGNLSAAPDGVAVYLSTGVAFSGNLVVANQAGGIYDEGHAQITSCTIANNCGTGLNLRATNTELYNSIVYANAVDVVGSLAQDVGNLVGTDPKFVGPGDYHLASNSPAIDQGDNASVPAFSTQDSDGDARLLPATAGGTPHVDIGWDEWRPGQASTTLSATGCSSADAGVDSGLADSGSDAAQDSGAGASTGGGQSGSGSSQGGAGGYDASAAGTPAGGNAGSMPDSGVVAPSDSGADAASTDNPASSGNSGCGCRLAPAERTPLAPLALASILAAFIARRRRGSVSL